MRIKDCMLLFQLLLLIVVAFISLFVYNSLSSLKELIAKDVANEQFMESMYVQDNLLLSITNDGSFTNLKDLQFEAPKLICYYSSQACGGCITFATQKIKEFFPDTNPNILFVTSGFNEKVKFKHKNLLNLGMRKMGLDLEDAMFVCYFILNNGQVEHLFIPEKTYSEYTDLYLKEIQKRYFSDAL